MLVHRRSFNCQRKSTFLRIAPVAPSTTTYPTLLQVSMIAKCVQIHVNSGDTLYRKLGIFCHVFNLRLHSYLTETITNMRLSMHHTPSFPISELTVTATNRRYAKLTFTKYDATTTSGALQRESCHNCTLNQAPLSDN